MLATKEKKSHPETAESGQFIRSTMLDMDTRLRVARAIEKDETQASIGVFQMPHPQRFQTVGAELTRR